MNSFQSYAKKMKSQHGARRIIVALKHSWQGFQAALEEEGFRQLLAIQAVLLAAAWWVQFDAAVRLLLMLAAGMCVAVELINTAIEAAVDHTSENEHPQAKRAKDAASAALYWVLLVEALLWGAALWRK